MKLRDKFNMTAEENDAALCSEIEKPLENSQQNPSQVWWESAMFTEPARESER